MSLETDVQALTTATTDLLEAVNVSKATLDDKVDDAGAFATASLNSANASAASAATATTQATAAGTARTGAEAARDAAIVAQNNAVAVVTGGTATLTPQAGKIPLADGLGKIAKGWLTNTDLVEQTDIGTAPNEIPLNQYLGEMAYMDANSIPTIGVATANLATANVTNLMQVTEVSTVMPTLNLDFAKVKQLDPRITFTRASTGTYYDGKTRAKAEENLLTFSQDFDNAVWAKNALTVTANTTTAPDGSLTADKLFTNSSTGYHSIAVAASVTGSSTYTLSVYVKAVEYSKFYIFEGGNGRIACDFDLVAVTAGTPIGAYTSKSATITAVGNGWYRCNVSFNTGVTEALSFGFVGYPNGATLNAFGAQYTGDGTSGVFLWGAQLEQRSAATAYTPTTTQPITNYIPVLMTAASGVPRFEHDPVTGESLGLEIEEQRTNLQIYSQEFSNATGWPNSGQFSSVEVNLSIAPDGTITADKVIPNSGVTGYGVFSNSFTWAASAYTASVYLKAAGQTSAQILFSSPVSASFVNFDLSTGVLGTVSAGASASIVSVGNGWYRCSVTITASASSGGWLVAPCSSPTSARGSGVTGNGFSGIYIWGAQLEAGAFPTSYIPTTTAQVTRAADSAVMTGVNFSSWYRQDEGTVCFENNYNFGSDLSSGLRVALQIDNGSATDRFILRNDAFANTFAAQVGGNTQASFNGATNTANFVKTAFGYATNNIAISNSGSLPSTDTSCLVPIVNTMRIGMFSNGALQLNGTIRKITYYPQRLSNAELVEITAQG
jgi:hypothetical protein